MHTEPYPKYILRNVIISGTSVAGGGNVPTGGTTGQYLRKISSTDFNTEWGTLTVANITDLTATFTELNYTDGVTSSIQTQLNAKVSTTLTSANIIVGNGSNVATAVAMSGDIGISNTGVTSIQAGVIVNADVNATAAIAHSKMAALTVSRALVSDGSGFTSVATTTATEIGYVNGVTSAIQTQLNAKLTSTLTSANVFVGNGSNIATGVAVTGDITISNAGVVAIAAGVIVNADVNASAAIALSKLATVTVSRALVSDGSGFISAAAVTATELGYVSGVTAAIQTQLDNEIATKTVNAIVKSPTVTQDGYAITWNNGAGEYTLTDPIVQGLTAGGSANQFLVKLSGTDYDAAWRLPLQSDISDVTASAAEVNILDGATLSTTELNYVDGVTAAIQTQLNAKEPVITGGATSITSANLATSKVLISDASGKVAVSSTASTDLGQWWKLGGTSTVTEPIITQTVGTSGSPPFVTFTGAAHTTLTQAEVVDIDFNLNRTVTFVNGAAGHALQRAVRFQAPTYAHAAGSTRTIAVAATVSISGAPAAGSNTTITNAYSLRTAAGRVLFDLSTGSTTVGGVTISDTVSSNKILLDLKGASGSVFNVTQEGRITVTSPAGSITLGVSDTEAYFKLAANVDANASGGSSSASQQFISGTVTANQNANILYGYRMTSTFAAGAFTPEVRGFHYNPTITGSPTVHYGSRWESGLHYIGNHGTTVPTVPANGVLLYAEDVAASSELKVKDEANNITTLSPHNFSLMKPSEDMAWSYYSERDGKKINVDMLKLARLVEKLSGEKLVWQA